MPNSYFQFKQFRIDQEKSGMKVTTDGCLFGGWVADEIRKSKEPKRILDIGAGTGLLSLMLAQATNHSVINAVEINESAFHEATLNFQKSPWADRLKCIQMPIQELTDEPNNLIICNPPFFKNSQTGKNADKNQAIHSSSLSIQDLSAHTSRLLNKTGKLYLLYPEWEMNEFTMVAKVNGLYPNEEVIVRNVKDGSIFRIMKMFSKTESVVKSSELIIRKEDRRYTNETWVLLKDYYLEYNAPC